MASNTENALANITKAATEEIKPSQSSSDSNTPSSNPLTSSIPGSVPNPQDYNLNTKEKLDAFNNAMQMQQQINIDNDFNNMPREAFISKYGQDTYNQQMSAGLQNSQLYRHDRSVGEFLGDSAIGVVQGIVSGGLGLATAGTMGMDPTGVTSLALGQANSMFNDWANSLKSEKMQAAMQRANIDREKAYLENKRDEQLDIAQGKNEYAALAKRILKDAGLYLAKSNATTFGDDVSQGLGFIFPAGAGARVLGAAGKVAGNLAGKGLGKLTGKSAEELADLALKGGKLGEQIGSSTMLNSALGYGGASAGNVAAQLDAIPAEDLVQMSPEAKELFEQKLSENGNNVQQALAETKQEIIHDTSLKAGIYAGIIAAIPSAFISKKYLKSFGTQASVKDIAKNVGENTAQGLVTLGENLAKQQNINPDQDLGEGVGANVGLGFTSSLSGGITGAPHAITAPITTKLNNKLEQSKVDKLDKQQSEIFDENNIKVEPENKEEAPTVAEEVNADTSTPIEEPVEDTTPVTDAKEEKVTTEPVKEPVKQEIQEENKPSKPEEKKSLYTKAKEGVINAKNTLLGSKEEIKEVFKNPKDDIPLTKEEASKVKDIKEKLVNKNLNTEYGLAEDNTIVDSSFALHNKAKEARKQYTKENTIDTRIKANNDVINYTESALRSLRDASIEEREEDNPTLITKVNKHVDKVRNNLLKQYQEAQADNAFIANQFETTDLNKVSKPVRNFLRETALNNSNNVSDTFLHNVSNSKLISPTEKELIDQNITIKNVARDLTKNADSFKSTTGKKVASYLATELQNVLGTRRRNPNENSISYGLGRLNNLLKTYKSALVLAQYGRHQGNNHRYAALGSDLTALGDVGKTYLTRGIAAEDSQAIVNSLAPVASALYNSVKNSPSVPKEFKDNLKALNNALRNYNDKSDSAKVFKEVSGMDINDPIVKENILNLSTLSEKEQNEFFETGKVPKSIQKTESEPRKETTTKSRDYADVIIRDTQEFDANKQEFVHKKEVSLNAKSRNEKEFNSLDELIAAAERGEITYRVIEDDIINEQHFQYTSDPNKTVDEAFVDYMREATKELITKNEDFSEYTIDDSVETKPVDPAVTEHRKEVIESLQKDYKAKSVIANYEIGTDESTALDQAIYKDLSKYGDFNYPQNSSEINTSMLTDHVVDKILDYDNPESVLGSVTAALNNLITKIASDKNTYQELLNGTSKLPVSIQLLFTADNESKLNINETNRNKLALAFTNALIKNQDFITSNKPDDLLRELSFYYDVSLDDIKAAKDESKDIKSGLSYLQRAGQEVPVDLFINSLTNSIKEFLGFNPDTAKAQVNECEYFFEDLATNLLDALDGSVIKVKTYKLKNEVKDSKGNVIEPAIYNKRIAYSQRLSDNLDSVFDSTKENISARQYKSGLRNTFIEDFYFNDADSQKTIEHSPEFKSELSPQATKNTQRWAELIQGVRYTFNPTMVKTLNSEDALVYAALKGAVLDNDSIDPNYIASVKGRIANITGATEFLSNLLKEVKEYASNYEGMSYEDVGKYFAQKVLSNSRLQALDPFDPSVDKLSREILSACKVTLNLSNSEDLTKYQQAIGQSLIKHVDIRTDEPKTINAKFNEVIHNITDLLNTKDEKLQQYKKVIEALDSINNKDISLTEAFKEVGITKPSEIADAIKSTFNAIGCKYSSPASLRAFLSLMKYINADENELNQFTSYDWIESDGTNHGPAHTQSLFSTDYSSNVVDSLALVGVAIGVDDANVVNATSLKEDNTDPSRPDEKVDFYSKATDKSNEELINNLDDTKHVNSSVTARKTFYKNVFSKEFSHQKANSFAEIYKVFKEKGIESALPSIEASRDLLQYVFSDSSKEIHLEFKSKYWEYTRDWNKPWVTQGGYQSGVDGITQNAMKFMKENLSELRNNIFKQLQILYPNYTTVDLLKQLRNFTSLPKDNKFRVDIGRAIYAANNSVDVKTVSDIVGSKEYTKFIDSIDNFIKDDVKSVSYENRKYNDELDSDYSRDRIKAFYAIKNNYKNTGIDFLKFGWDAFTYDMTKYYTLYNNLKNLVIEPANVANKEILRKQSGPVADKIVSISDGVAHLYNRVLSDKIKEMINNGTYTYANLKKLMKEYTSLNNDYIYNLDGKDIGFTLRQQGNIPLSNNKRNVGNSRKARKNKYAVSVDNTDYVNTHKTLSGKEYSFNQTFSGSKEPGVSGMAIATQAASDVANMSWALTSLAEKGILPQGVTAHDGFHASLNYIKPLATALNTAASHTFFGNPLTSFYQKHLTIANALFSPDTDMYKIIEDLVNRVNDAIENHDFSKLNNQDISDYLSLIKQFLRPNSNNSVANPYTINYRASGVQEFISNLRHANNTDLADVYEKLVRKTIFRDINGQLISPENVKAQYIDLYSLTRNTNSIIESVRANPENFPIYTPLTMKDIQTLAQDSITQVSKQVDKINNLHTAAKEFGVVVHHFGGDSKGIAIKRSTNPRIAQLAQEYDIDNPSITPKERYARVGQAINARANELAILSKNPASEAVKGSKLISTTASQFLEKISGLEGTDLPVFNLISDIVNSNFARGNSLPTLVYTDGSIFTLPNREEEFEFGSTGLGKYIYDNGQAYIVINRENIRNVTNGKNFDIEIQRVIAHEFLHGTVGEAVSDVFNTWLNRSSITPMNQREHLVANLVTGVYSLCKVIKINLDNKKVPAEALREYLISNYGESFGGNLLYSMLTNSSTEVDNNPYSQFKQLFDKFADSNYTRAAFIRDLIHSDLGHAFIDEFLAFSMTSLKDEFKNIDKQVDLAKYSKDKNLSLNLAKLFIRTKATLQKISKLLLKGLRNLFFSISRKAPTREEITALEKTITESYSNTMLANVSSLAQLQVRNDSRNYGELKKVRNDSYINNDGSVNKALNQYSDKLHFDLDTSDSKIAESLANVSDTLAKYYTDLEITKLASTYKYPNQELSNSNVAKVINAEKITKAAGEVFKISGQVKSLVKSVDFLTDSTKDSLFENLFRTIHMTSNLNNQTYSRLSQLRSYILENSSYEDFLNNKDNPNEIDIAQAQRKYDLLSGKLINPAEFPAHTANFEQAMFYAIACLDPTVQEIMNKLPVPNVYKSSKGNNIADKVIISAVDSITEFTTKTLATNSLERTSKTAKDAVFKLLTAFNNKELDESLHLEKLDIVGQSVDAANSLVQKGIGALFDSVNTKFGFIKANTEDGTRPAFFSDKDFGSYVGEGVTDLANRHIKYDFLNDLIKDIVGSTTETYTIFQHEKQAHSEVQQVRQQYRENIANSIVKSFKNKHTPQEYARITDCIQGCDLQALYDLGIPEIKSLIKNKAKLQSEIAKRENVIKASILELDDFNRAKRDSLHLAHWLATQGQEYSHDFKYNAYAILTNVIGSKKITPKLESTLDQLISMYALQEYVENSKENTKFLSNMLESEEQGMNQILGTLNTQIIEQQNAILDPRIKLNSVKGFLGEDSRDTTHITIDKNDSATRKELENLGYTFLQATKDGKHAYYISNLPAKGMFMQGSIQDIHYSVCGVNANGFRNTQTVERVYDPNKVKEILSNEYANDYRKPYASERLVPVYDIDPVTDRLRIVNFERTADKSVLNKARPQRHIAILTGITAGRMHEMAAASKLNSALIEKTYKMWAKAADKSQYVNLFNYLPKDRSKKSVRYSKDPIIADALTNMPIELLRQIAQGYDNTKTRAFLVKHIKDIAPDYTGDPEIYLDDHPVFMVRKDMIKDIIGLRHPSITDAWTGISRWSPKTQTRIRHLAESIFGVNNAYKYLYTTELATMKAVSFARNNIVIRSVSVGVENMIANIYQLMLRGVPLKEIYKGIPDIYTQLDMYTRDKNELIQLEAKMAATKDPAIKEKLRIRENIINDRINRLEIKPLIDAGEFSTVADVGLTDEEVLFTHNKFIEAFHNALNSDKVPKYLSVPTKYFLVTKDTALYRTLEKSVQYGDFIAKAIRYKHLTKYKNYASEDAMRLISDEFVNYDRLGGRNRTYLENIGLLWFYNFKLRMTKVHLSMLKDDPVRVLLNCLSPMDLPTPMKDSIIGKFLSGGLGYSTGMGMGFNAWKMNPWIQLFGE